MSTSARERVRPSYTSSCRAAAAVASAFVIVASSGCEDIVGPGTIGDPTGMPGLDADAGAGAPGTPGSSSGDPGSAGGMAPGDLPCGVADLLARRCLGCHGGTPATGVPTSLAGYDHLVAPSVSDPARSVAEVALDRMRDTVSPMPPAPLDRATAAEIDQFQAWVTSGTPRGSCSTGGTGGSTMPDPYATPTVCSSGTYWNGGTEESSLMEPGMACISCHSRGEGPRFDIAGTVYDTAHEPESCNGSRGAIQVEITDVLGNVLTLSVNSAGNFFHESWGGAITPPYTARVLADGRVRAMSTPQTSGDCNGCHTETGAMMAPGRIMRP